MTMKLHVSVVICCVALLAAFATTSVAASDPSAIEPKSPAVRAAREKYDAAVKKAAAELAAARAAYSEQLDAGVKAALKSEDLDEANRIDSVRKALRDGAATTVAGAGQPKPGTPAAGEKKPGWIVGALKDSAGKPIKDVKFTVNVYGTTLQGGQKASFVLDVDGNGHFEQELPDGLYSATASVVKEFEGSRYLLRLHPDDNKHESTKVASKPGIVKNFTWKLTGLRPELDPKQSFSYYGPHVQVYDARYLGEDNEKLAAEFGQDAQATLTLTPTSTLIDGSTGQPITITAPLKEIGTTIGYVAMNQPIATYRITAKVGDKPLRVKLNFSDEPADSVEGTFKQRSEYASIEPIQVYLSK